MANLDTTPFALEQVMSTITAIIPRVRARDVIDEVMRETQGGALLWDARGTLLQEQWYRRLLPSISPAKMLIQLLVPDNEVDRVLGVIVDAGKLHLQSTGAVFCTPCDDLYLGHEFDHWPIDESVSIIDGSHDLRENLDVIYYIAESERTQAIASAAIKAGSHGPIVYFSEGRGLRDRLGWLRITKQTVKEVITVIVDSSDADSVFAAMAKAGGVQLPGRGFMYRVPIEKGMFNLPSIVAQHQYPANMQQIINAIDHLNGHSHWRDQTVFSVGGDGKGAGLSFFETEDAHQEEQTAKVSQQAVVRREVVDQVIEMFLNAGAAGLNVSHVRRESGHHGKEKDGQLIPESNNEYSMLRCVMNQSDAVRVAAAVASAAAQAGLQDMCLYRQPVAQMATYIPSAKDFRRSESKAS